MKIYKSNIPTTQIRLNYWRNVYLWLEKKEESAGAKKNFLIRIILLQRIFVQSAQC